MTRLDPVVRLSGNRLAIVFPNRHMKVVQIQEDGSPQELLDLDPDQLQQMADATWLPSDISLDDGLAIVLAWLSTNKE